MLGFQTLACLQDIPIVRSSTDKIQDVYAKAKETSFLVRLPCSVAETVVDKSLKIALTVVNPFVKPFSGPVRAIDNYAAQKIRQMETKYPVITARPEDVVNSFNEKTEPVRNAMNSVKDTTTSTIQQGKETVSNVATATVNKASGVADSVFTFCGSGMQRYSSSQSTGLTGFVCSSIGSLLDFAFQSIRTSSVWFRMLVVFFLLKSKQINDLVLNKIQRKPFLSALPQRLLILSGIFLDFFITRIRPDDRTLAELKKSKQQQYRSNQPQYFVNRPNLKQDPATKPRQNVIPARPRPEPVFTQQQVFHGKEETVVSRSSNSHSVPKSQPDYSNLNDTQELYARLAANDCRQSAYTIDNDEYPEDLGDGLASDDIAQLHAQIKPTDVELLYTRLPADVLPVTDDQDTLNPDQQQLHARIIGAELERQGYEEN